MTVESYKQVLMEDAFDASCISKLADEIENARALPFIKKIDFHKFPSEIQKPRKNIICGMAGCFRHKKMFNRSHKDFRIIAVDSSPEMLKYGAEKYDAPEEDLICCEVQDFDFKSFSEQVSLWFCWWNACYLNHT